MGEKNHGGGRTGAEAECERSAEPMAESLAQPSPHSSLSHSIFIKKRTCPSRRPVMSVFIDRN